jgi:hypothetical protein
MQVYLFDDEFALLVLLTWFIGLGVGPSYESLASFAGDVTYCVQTSDEESVFGLRENNVDALIK